MPNAKIFIKKWLNTRIQFNNIQTPLAKENNHERKIS